MSALTGPGRPSKLTAQRHAIILGALRKGANLKDAAHLAGITPRALHAWLTRGEQGGEEPYATFAQAVREAQAAPIDAALEVVQEAIQAKGPDSLKAATWLLDRKGYRPDQVVQLDARVQSTPVLDARRLDPDQAKQLAQLLALASGESDALGDFAGLEAYERRRDALDAGDPALLLPGDVAWIQANPAEAENQGWTMDNGRPVPFGGEE